MRTSGCFPRLTEQHDGAYLAEKLAKCLKDYGIEKKVCYVMLLVHKCYSPPFACRSWR